MSDFLLFGVAVVRLRDCRGAANNEFLESSLQHCGLNFEDHVTVHLYLTFKGHSIWSVLNPFKFSVGGLPDFISSEHFHASKR